LKTLKGPIDFLLMDIWTPMARPALERVVPHMRGGAVVIADNTTMFRSVYGDYFDYLTDPKNGFPTMTLPFEGGLEYSVKNG
jgi:predicted O-methyltransferase YrrM